MKTIRKEILLKKRIHKKIQKSKRMYKHSLDSMKTNSKRLSVYYYEKGEKNFRCASSLHSFLLENYNPTISYGWIYLEDELMRLDVYRYFVKEILDVYHLKSNFLESKKGDYYE